MTSNHSSLGNEKKGNPGQDAVKQVEIRRFARGRRINFIELVMQRLGQNLASLVLGLLLFGLYHIVIAALSLGVIRTGISYTAPGEMTSALQTMAFYIYGIHGAGSVLAGILAVNAGCREFSWIDNRQMIDFYESQPVSRKARFWGGVCTEFIVFLLPCLSTLLIGLAVTAGMGGYSAGLIGAALYQVLQSGILFMGIFSVTVLAMMLCGNVIIALLGTGLLLTYELFARLVLYGLQDVFYKTTYNNMESFDYYTEPRLSPVTFYLQSSEPGMAMTASVKGVIFTLAVLGFAYVIWMHRRHEFAGSAVIFRPARIIIKLAITALCASGTGLMIYSIFASESDSHAALIPTVLCIILGAVITAAVMEVIYNYNIRAMFRHLPEMAAAVLLSLGVFCFYYLDVSGYDRYVPDTSRISTAAVYLDDTRGRDYLDAHGSYIGTDAFMGQHMALSDLDAVTALARDGQKRLRSLEMSGNDGDKDTYLNMVVQYKLKNGKTVYRSLLADKAADREQLNRILADKSYQDSLYDFGGYLMKMHPGTEQTISYNAGWKQNDKQLNQELLDGLQAAYKEDLQQYNYDFAARSFSVGEIVISGMQTEEDYLLANPDEDSAAWNREYRHGEYAGESNVYFEVYPEYTSTISFLKQHGLWLESIPDKSIITRAELSRRWDYRDSYDSYDGDDTGENMEAVYSGNDLDEILPGLVHQEWVQDFHTADEYDAMTCLLYLREQDDSMEGQDGSPEELEEDTEYAPYDSTIWMLYPKGKAPARVYRDLQMQMPE